MNPRKSMLVQKVLSKSPRELLSSFIYKLKFLEFKRIIPSESDPRKTGEAHKWMYDKLSLKILLEDQGFLNFSINRFDESKIKSWSKYNLDRSVYEDLPKRPESLYVECEKI